MEDELPTRPLNQPPNSAQPAGGVWLVSFGDEDDRELTVQQISEALGRGEIDPGTIVWREGMKEWQPISQLIDLRAALREFAGGAPARKKRTVLGGFATDASKLRVSTRQTARIWSPGAPPAGPAAKTGEAPPPPPQVVAPAAPPPAPSPERKPGGLLNQGTRRRTLLGTGFKVPAPAAANAPLLRGSSSQKESGAADAEVLEPAREEAFAFPLNRRLEAQQTPTVPQPRVRSAAEPGTGSIEAIEEEEEPETQRPVVASRPTPPRRMARRPLPHSPGRPSRPPPARPPSRNPPAPLLRDDAEPISLVPDSVVESLPPDALDSVVANLPPLEAPSAPAISDADRDRRSEVDVDVSEGIPRAQEHAGDSVLVGSDAQEPMIDSGAENQRYPAQPPRTNAVEQALELEPDFDGAADSDAPTRKAEKLTAVVPLSLPRESADSKSGDPTALSKELSKEYEQGAASPALELRSSDELPLPSTAPPKKASAGKIVLAVLLIGCGVTVFAFSRTPPPNPTVAASPVPIEDEETALPDRDHAPLEPSSSTHPAAETAVEQSEPQTVDRAPAPPKVDRIDSPPAPRVVPRQPQAVAANEDEPAKKPAAPAPAKPPPQSLGGGLASASQEPAGPFDKAAAVAALESAAGRAAACRKPGDPSGVARVNVTFTSSGRATRAVVNGPPFSGTATGGCIASTMRGARVPKFEGDLITVTKKVVIQ